MGLALLIPFVSIGATEAPYEPLPIQEHYSRLITAFQKGHWNRVVYEGKFITATYPYSPFTPESHYYLATAFFELRNYDFANRHFSAYLKSDMSPKYFQESILKKFEIAKLFDGGERTALFGSKHLPKWVTNRELSIEIYNEVITSLPRSEMAAESLFRKGMLLANFSEFKESVESFETLIRRFPKNQFAPECFIGIAEVYLKQVQDEFPDPDLIHLADINLDQFKQSFPGEPRVADVEALLEDMSELFAKELFEVGDFYERTKKLNAAKIYFQTLITQYPSTTYAEKSDKRLARIQKKQDKLDKKSKAKS